MDKMFPENEKSSYFSSYLQKLSIFYDLFVGYTVWYFFKYPLFITLVFYSFHL